jgi:hypothetical protein
MARVTPRRIINVIEKSFPWTADGNRSNDIHPVSMPQLRMIADLSRELPIELRPQDPDVYTEFIGALGAIEGAVLMWAGLSSRETTPLHGLVAFGGRAAVVVLRDALLTCPEGAIATTTRQLDFISDPQLKESIRNDLSQSRRALDRGDYKAATILAGAALEALLLHVLEQIPDARRQEARKTWNSRSKRPSDAKPRKGVPAADLGEWPLLELTWVAHYAGGISAEAAAAADVARDYRNLIHPGKARRLSVPADEGTAFSALGAAVRVAAELERRSDGPGE